eukprot:3390255-Pyramimonas_sp.AAC.1
MDSPESILIRFRWLSIPTRFGFGFRCGFRFLNGGLTTSPPISAGSTASDFTADFRRSDSF